jgi:dGTPase
MKWTTCFSSERFGIDNARSPQRTEYERDWDRLIFSSAFRRLQNKTQVFPLPEEVFVHNRLTHSLEVASVGRSLGSMVGEKIALLPDVASDENARSFYFDHLKNVISSACLAHDMGNPAFGHSGEEAISRYFQTQEKNETFRSRFSNAEWADLISFEGNANALRILTRAFKGRLPGGFRLTYSTLGAILKYPCSSSDSLGKKGPKHRSKYGFFQSDKAVFQQIASRLGMVEEEGVKGVYKRHPFVYLVEAADDICYNIIDFEDAHRLRIFTTEEVQNTFLELLACNPKEDMGRIRETLASLNEDANESISYLRAKSINYLTGRCSEIFFENRQAILSGNFTGDLIGSIQEAQVVLKEIKRKSVAHIYNHPSVVKIELAGFRIMSGLVEDLVSAALEKEEKRDPMQKKVISLIGSQYIFQESDSDYEKVLCLFDFVGGMTDLYALKLYRNLRGIEIPTI